MKPTPTQQRNREIVRMRSEGVPVKDVCKHFGLSKDTVKGIVSTHRRVERETREIERKHGHWLAGFSRAVRNALIRSEIYTVEELHKAVQAKAPVWNVGSKALEEINATIDRKIKRVYKRMMAYDDKAKDWTYAGEVSYLDYVEG